MQEGTKTGASAAPANSDFRWYLGSGSFWMGGQHLQQFLVPWLLVGVLGTTPALVGTANLLIALPGFVFMLLGGITADRVDGRRMLLLLQGAAVLPPLLLIAVVQAGALNWWWVVACGLGVSALMSTSEPPRAALLNRVTRTDVQRAVALYTAVSTLLGLLATRLGGELDRVGLVPVLLVQAGLFALATLALGRVQPGAAPAVHPGPTEPPWRGFKLVAEHPLIRDITLFTFISAIFNAGAFFVVLPFLATRVYAGDALFFANMLILFWLGSIGSNLLLYRVSPLQRPGRLFLVMQLSRVLLLLLLWMEPPVWGMLALVFLWGMNQGITTPLARGMVQGLAPETHRARVLSVFMMGFLASAPLGGVVLGGVVEVVGVLNALLPGAFVSLLLFVWGVWATGLWRWQPARD